MSPTSEQTQPSTPQSVSPADALSPSPVHSSSSNLIPPPRFYHDPVLLDRIQQLEKEVQQLSGHVKMVELELQNEKRKSNQRDGRASKRRKVNVEERMLTSAEGKRLAAEKDAEHVGKAQKKKEAERIRKEKEVARDQQRRAPPDEPFVGSLASKNKADLQEIAGALSLPVDCTKGELIQRINSFDSNPLQRISSQFSGLFNRRAQRRCPKETEILHPAASTSQNLPQHTHRPLADNIQLVNLPNVSYHLHL